MHSKQIQLTEELKEHIHRQWRQGNRNSVILTFAAAVLEEQHHVATWIHMTFGPHYTQQELAALAEWTEGMLMCAVAELLQDAMRRPLMPAQQDFDAAAAAADAIARASMH